MIKGRTLYLFVPVTMALLIGDLVYRVYTRPQEFPYDLLVVIAAVSILGLLAMIPELTRDKNVIGKRWLVTFVPASLLVGLVGFTAQVMYEYASGSAIRWEKHLSDLYSMLAAFVTVLVVGLGIIGVIRVRSRHEYPPAQQ